MYLLLMTLIACGGNATQEAETTEEAAVQTTETTENVPATTEAAKTEVTETSKKKPASDEETQETTDQTVNNQENTTEE